MRRSRLVLLAAALCVGTAIAAVPAGKPELGTFGVDLTGMDRSVKPGDNFFYYVNGTWMKKTEIPADRSSIGAFQQLRILSEKRLKEIVADLKAKPVDKLTPEEKKLRDLFDAFTDTKAIDAAGLAPAKADLDTIAAIKDLDGVARVMSAPRMSVASVFNMSIGVDEKDPNAYSIVLTQGGLGMPDRDYYLRDDAALAAARDAYKKYLAQMLTLAGAPDAEKRAQAIYDVEAKIAQVHWTRAENRDEDKTYNPMTVSDLKKLAPDFAWDAFFAEAGIPMKGPKGERVVVVTQKSAFPALAKIFHDTPVEVWRDYLTVHYLHAQSSYLPKAFDDADFDFYGKVLGGQSVQLDRATRGVHLLDNLLGEALGKLYVAKYFPPDSKKKAEELVANLLKAYDADIRTLPWMSEATRQKALEKLHKFTPHIGYPDKWIDYSAYTVQPGALLADTQNGVEFEWHRELNRIDQPVDKGEWGMTPSTVNAYYNPSINEVVFPAAILQAPFFDPNADPAVNYGGIGAVIGHEISHGFDDQGAKYDGDGVLRDWWTPEDFKNFKAKTQALSDQFDQYEALPGLHVIGANTLGEDIADLAGITIALKAYKLSLNGKPAPVIDGYTAEQRFYLSYAQIWRSKYRENALRTQVLSNEHAPAEFRAISATRNSDAWYTAFGAKPGDKYYLAPDKRVRLW
ncbi:MAG: M13 family metallopeptidase [Alphaproteobacteria bacterium]|nr:M13 family metallopeptidase [Alphaproteobacteria bacterium]MBL7096790.1 M13 family metallopeptidase [Alphaproteobacteria bacterium]